MIPRLEICFPLVHQRLFVWGKPFEPSEDEYLLNHSRSCIMLALQAAGLPAEAKVGVMVYNCHTVMNAVEQAGFKPVFLDVNENLTLDIVDLRRKAYNLSAIVVTHLFGILNDVERIKDEFPNLVIIEDCAHAYGIGNIFGDFATFSIGQGKLPSIGDGGILKVLNVKYNATVKSLYCSLPGYTKIQKTKLFISICAKSLMHSRYIYGWLTFYLKKIRKIPSGREVIIQKKMCDGISAIFAKEKENVIRLIELRKKNAQCLISSLPEGVDTYLLGTNAFMLVLLCDNPQKIQTYYRNKGIDTDTHFAHSLQWAKEFGYSSGSCPNAEKLRDRILVLPTYYNIVSLNNSYHN